LVALAEATLRLNDISRAARLIDGLKWCKSEVVDPVLANMARHPDEGLRHQAVRAVGYRAVRREGPVETLRELLGHHDTMTRFLAAIGLGRAGHADGVAVLLTAVTAFEGQWERRQAVETLGKIADERALDTLVDIAADEDHELRDVAVE